MKKSISSSPMGHHRNCTRLPPFTVVRGGENRLNRHQVGGALVMLTGCRYLALAYAIGLAIGEAVINSSQEHWQYAPLWIIDYVIVAYLVAEFWPSQRGS